MMHRAAFALVTMMLALGGCGQRAARPVVSVGAASGATTGWQAMVTPTDDMAVAALPARWVKARAAVPPRFKARLIAEKELADPAVALELPAPPPGPYHCRLVRFGGRAGVTTFPPDFCYVDGDGAGLSFTKQTGGIRPSGWLHPDGATRLVFLGAVPRAGATGVPLYGTDPVHDVAGVVERVSPFRWRLTMARAGRGALLDVYELVPVTPAVPGASPAVPAR